MSETKEKAQVEVKVGISIKELAIALQGLSDEDKEFFIENLLAATSSEYLESIKEARKDYEEGRTLSSEQVFKK